MSSIPSLWCHTYLEAMDVEAVYFRIFRIYWKGMEYATSCNILWMEEILHQLMVYTLVYRVSSIQGGAGFRNQTQYLVISRCLKRLLFGTFFSLAGHS